MPGAGCTRLNSTIDTSEESVPTTTFPPRFVDSGAVLGAAMALIGSYLVGVQRKYEAILNEIIEGDLVAAWSNPTSKMHKAAENIQCCFR